MRVYRTAPAPNNFMTTTCQYCGRHKKLSAGRELILYLNILLLVLVHKQCFAVDDDSILRTFSASLVVLLFIKQFCASASALRVCLSGIRYWFSITPTPARRSSSIAPFLSPFAIFSFAIFIAALLFGSCDITREIPTDALMTIYWSSLRLVFLPGLANFAHSVLSTPQQSGSFIGQFFCLFWIAMKQSQACHLTSRIAYKPCSEIRSAAAVFWFR